MIKKVGFQLVVLLFLSMVAVCFSSQEHDSMYNGFKQFLGDVRNYTCEPLSGGMSYNAQYLCMANDTKYVARVLKESLPIRQSEVSVHLYAASNNIAPKVYYHHHSDDFSLVIMEFVNAHTLSLEQACSHEVLDQIVEKIKAIQQFDASLLLNNDKRDLFAEITENYKKVKNKNKNLLDLGPILEDVWRKAATVNQKVQQDSRQFVVNHNDLLPRNIFFTGNKIVIIDWEMVALNDEFYDLASYSMFSCLSDADDHYLLTKYFECSPSDRDMQHFKRMKLMSRAFDTFSCLAFLDSIPESIPMESIKDFAYYQNIFAQDSSANSAEFLYTLTIGQIREFFKEYKIFENDDDLVNY